jgi:cytochrome c oxidase subunit 4
MDHSTSHPSDADEHSSTRTASHALPLRTYYMVYGALIVLLVLTVAVAEFHLGGIGLVVALLIAFVKAWLVLLYFMHLRQSSRLTWLFAGAGLAWLLLLFAGTIQDYLSRGWVGQ